MKPISKHGFVISINLLLPVIAKVCQKTNNIIQPYLTDNNSYGNDTTDNCWGYVAKSCGWITHREWLDNNVMDKYLQKHTKPVYKKDATTGDIAIYRYEGGRLCHTAIVIDTPKTLLHKPGTYGVEFAKEEYVNETYPNTKVSYARIYE